MLPREYARTALGRGLKYEQEIGANPFKFGMIGSTDSHTPPATFEEDNYFGKATPAEPSAEPDRFQEIITGLMQQPGGFDTRHLEQEGRGIAVRMAGVGRSGVNWRRSCRRDTINDG